MSVFEAAIEEAPRGGAFVVISADIVEQLGGGGRIPVIAEFDGVEYRGSIVRMGGQHVLGMLRAIQDELGKTHGDPVTVTVERDRSERRVELPTELAALFESDPEARQAFEALSYSHRREHANYVAEAKKPETRERRARKTVESLRG